MFYSILTFYVNLKRFYTYTSVTRSGVAETLIPSHATHPLFYPLFIGTNCKSSIYTYTCIIYIYTYI